MNDKEEKMDNLNLLKNELLRMGYNRAQADSKVVPAVLSICANNPQILEVGNVERELKELQSDYSHLDCSFKRRKQEYDALINKLNDLHDIADAKEYYDKACRRCDESDKKVEDLFKALNTGETAEGRDGLRKAQMFIQNINIDTKYDNTAYIIGLSAILSNGAIEPIGELTKINPKINRSLGRHYFEEMEEI